jgi:hypothetical protein
MRITVQHIEPKIMTRVYTRMEAEGRRYRALSSGKFAGRLDGIITDSLTDARFAMALLDLYLTQLPDEPR